MKRTALIAALLFSLTVFSQELRIIPEPVSVKTSGDGKSFRISGATTIALESKGLEKTAAYLNDYLRQFYNTRLNVVNGSGGNNSIRLKYQQEAINSPGTYILIADEKGITIQGNNPQGLFYGIQTLLQLLPAEKNASAAKLNVPLVTIEDSPRFAYRGMHLDVSRHFFPVSFVKKYIDYLALHKFNTFHWHLTDDQGWRIEIKKYPLLTSVGGWRNGTIIGRYPGTGNDKLRYGGFYTQQEIKEVVKYAADRYIDIVPEIEMPGHSSAAIAAYPQLSCFPDEPTINYFPKQCVWNGDTKGKQVQQTWGVFDDVFCAGSDSTFLFLQNVLDEVLNLFPGKNIHVGGDECPKENWKRCPRCQQRLKNEGLADEHQLQSYFIQRIEKYLNARGRTLIGWDEILEGGLAPNAIVMSWRGEEGGVQAARERHKVIMTPGNPVYFDHTQSESEDSVTIGGYNPLEKVYAYEPIPGKLEGEAREYVMGAQANVWTEYMHYPSKVEYMIFPRMAALSEVLWSLPDNKSWQRFEEKLPGIFRRYDMWKANSSKAYYELHETILPTADHTGILWKLESKMPGARIEGLMTSPLAKRISYTGPIKINASTSATMNIAGIKKSLSRTFKFNKATGKEITLTDPPSTKYPGDGAFTLVNGVQNDRGTERNKEFIGFNGTNCEAVIDLGKKESISKVVVHTLNQTGSWIWRPQTVEVFIMDENGKYVTAGLTDDFTKTPDTKNNGTMQVSFGPKTTQRIKVVITNWGEIPAGNPGAGSKPWLFVDEIEVD